MKNKDQRVNKKHLENVGYRYTKRTEKETEHEVSLLFQTIL